MDERSPITSIPGAAEEHPEPATMQSQSHSDQTLPATVCQRAGELTDRVLDFMGQGFEKLDASMPQDSCCSGVLNKIRSFEDPVQLQRCSVPRLSFTFLSAACLVMVILEIADDDENEPAWRNMGELLSNVFTMLLALFIAVFLGGDLFMFNSFVMIVNNLHDQITDFRKQNELLEEKLRGLSHVEQGLDHVYSQMGGSIEATTILLLDLDRFGKLQTVSAVVNVFFASDYDNSGHISGPEATLLTPQLTALWDLVPSFDPSRFAEHAQLKGLTLAQLATILDSLVNEDEAACSKALEIFCNDSEAPALPTRTCVSDPMHKSAPPAWVGAAMQLAVEDGGDPSSPIVVRDSEAEWRPRAIVMNNPLLDMAPPAAVVGSPQEDTSPVSEKNGGVANLTPICSIPVPSCHVGPFSMGNRWAIWGVWHLMALCCVPLSVGFLLIVIDGGEITNIIVAAIGLSLSLGLTGTGKLMEVIRVLRKQLRQLREEIVRLGNSCAELADKTVKLSKIQHGFEKLQRLCAGNVDKARELIQKSRAKVKMEAMAVVTHLFKRADANKNFAIDADETASLLNSLELVFRQLPGFDMSVLTGKLASGGMGMKEVKEVVEEIAEFGEGLGLAMIGDAPPVPPPVSAAALSEPTSGPGASVPVPFCGEVLTDPTPIAEPSHSSVPVPSSGTAQPTQTLAEQLRDLKKLQDDGIITESEFQRKKEQILGMP